MRLASAPTVPPGMRRRRHFAYTATPGMSARMAALRSSSTRGKVWRCSTLTCLSRRRRSRRISVPLVSRSRHQVDFQLDAHIDHAGGIAALQRASGAQVLASAAGARELELGGADPRDPQYGSIPDYTPVKHVRVVRDGQRCICGTRPSRRTDTPGHTTGSTSWTWTSCEKKRCLHMVYADSLTAVSAPTFRFGDHPRYRRGLPAIDSHRGRVALRYSADAASGRQRVLGESRAPPSH